MQIPRIDIKNLLGLGDKVVGLGKEATGLLLGRDNLRKAGEVQQDKGTERLKAIRAQVEADAHSARASAAGRTQRGAQKTKEAVR